MNEKLDNKINQVLSGWATPSIKPKNIVWEAIVEQIRIEPATVVPLHKWRWVAAASIFFIAVSVGAFYSAQVNISTQSQKIAFTLPDGSHVDLNKNSTASYNTLLWYFNKSVSLSGEGFFTVKKGEKFSVNTKNETVTVLGTSFNVLARNNNFKVACFTGKVVVTNGVNTTIITKGEIVTQSIEQDLIKKLITNTMAAPAWLTEGYSYNNKKLATVLADISDYFEIKISANAKINKLSFTGTWNKSMTLDDVLQIVCLPFELEVVPSSDTDIKIRKIKK